MDHLNVLLSEAQARLAASPGSDTIDWLARELATSFDAASSAGELAAFQAFCQAHPLSEVFLSDPYSRRAFEKPRGYAGDAVMLDFIYRPTASRANGLAGVVHQATTTLPNAKSILWRRDYLATIIYKYMRQREMAEVLSVASGHMRELDALRLLTSDNNVQFTALDQDGSSIVEAKGTYPEYRIAGLRRTFATLIRGNKVTKKYDLIYSAGLFDYLHDATATALIGAMFPRLKPGGMLSIGNFTPDSHGRGFMAGFMDWCLIYRNEDDLRSLAQKACPTASYRIFRDQPRNVVYLEIFAEQGGSASST
ncbi:class I SAM-dependent methyltransferase [Methylobacterium segetis]|uniref:class I SAM-dependent methyltransferase n=1 Tax=Methylobacterium segetis TaxID=2488750 RepID=UPI001047A0EE|nr:class I SAM-dependent methyltransferase [Methylobacterium segetis]